MVPASGSKIKKTLLYTARMRESDAADPSEAFPRWGNASVPEKHRQDRREHIERETYGRFIRELDDAERNF